MNLRNLYDTQATGCKTALITTTVGCLGLLAYTATVQEKVVYLPYAFITIALASVLLGGLRSGLAARSLGWFHGGLVGLIYSAVVYAAKAVMFPVSADISASAVFTAGLLLAGMVGGVTGVNLSFSRRTRVRRRYMGL